MDDFNVRINADAINNDTVVVTSSISKEELEKHEAQIVSSALAKVRSTDQYSVYPTDDTNSNALTVTYIDQLASGIHSNIENLKIANQIIVKNVDSDGLMGYTYSVIHSNFPTKYNISYKKVPEGAEDKTLEIRELIENFNDSIHLSSLIKQIGSAGYLEGNVPITLRAVNGGYVVDLLPLSIAYPSDYRINGDNLIEFDIKTLKTKLNKTYKKTRKNKAIYFENIQKEIKGNFGDEVVKAYNDGESYVRLNPKFSDCVTVNNLGRKFGVSPFFRSLKPLVVLNNIQTADVSDSNARSKKIIFQKLRKELATGGQAKSGLYLTEQELAHNGLMQALKTNLCAYTAPWFVESLEFVSSKANNDDASKQMVQYTTKYLQSLGIEFIDTESGGFSGVNVSITQIVRAINDIKSDIERVFSKFYKTVLEINGIDPSLAPSLRIDDAETLEMEMRLDLAKFAYGTLNASLDTVFNLIGLDINEETVKRKQENEDNLDKIFAPRVTAYTNSGGSSAESVTENGKSTAGRPQSNKDKSKQDFDKNYRKSKNN